MELAVFGAGCFWCVEAVFQKCQGVSKVVSGYAGGRVQDPNYQIVCTGTSGHAEVCQITFDPKVVLYPKLLEIFWKAHDPTTPDRQGNDVGTQYRSIIFYHDEEQKEQAYSYREKLNRSGAFSRPIVTQIEAMAAHTFYPAEGYHQNYYRNNPQQPYCQFMIQPKMEKLRQAFPKMLKHN